MKIVRDLKRLWRIYKAKPCITVSDHGWKGGRHQITVGVSSGKGVTSVCSFDLDPRFTEASADAVHARVEERANTLAHILCLRVIDRRPNTDANYRRHAPADWVWLPRDQQLWENL